MNECKTIAGERTQTGDGKTHTEQSSDMQAENLGSERGGLLYNGRTAKEWFGLHEVIRQDYGRAIEELEAQDREIRKHEALDKEHAEVHH